MGYACPVCETPQRDAEHLANHLAFTAMLHGDAHEEWLDDHAPDWSEAGVAELAPVVVEYADDVAYDEVFEDTVERQATDHAHERSSVASPFDAGDLDADAQRALAEAREMTRAMLDEADEDDKA
ncbi:MAG: DUF5810 domain-containing protein [Haloplanus sp.]